MRAAVRVQKYETVVANSASACLHTTTICLEPMRSVCWSYSMGRLKRHRTVRGSFFWRHTNLSTGDVRPIDVCAWKRWCDNINCWKPLVPQFPPCWILLVGGTPSSERQPGEHEAWTRTMAKIARNVWCTTDLKMWPYLIFIDCYVQTFIYWILVRQQYSSVIRPMSNGLSKSR